ncbi:MAG TPA: DbpA RNA binding domain-containing protein, partial [Gemmatimonadaceae bacterium]|nr:DbpA RNA binding domain-containing protein [Gemmatimonadaceae bacterium]
MEHDARESAVITRGQNVVYVMPHDWASLAQVLAPLLDRVDDTVTDLQLLVVAADAEAAAASAAAVVRLVGARPVRALAATSASRAARLMATSRPQVVCGAPNELLALVHAATLKLETVRVVVLAWVDELLAGGGEAQLESLLADVPKEAARVIVANAIDGGVEALIERYARRARRVAPPVTENDAPTSIAYVSVSAASRPATLRRLLDDLDPARAVVYVRTDESEFEARDTLRGLGYDPDAEQPPVRVARSGGADPVDLVVLYDVPASREELREAAGASAHRLVALVQPRQLGGLRTLAAGGAVTPLTLPEAASRARSREAVVRGELRDVLTDGSYARELLALEPLLDEYDGIEIAAAALRLLEEARRSRPAAAVRPEARGAAAPASTFTRLYVNVGAVDQVRPADLVGAITSEAGITSAQIGKIDIRENHSLVEVSTEIAEDVAAKLTGKSIRGRRTVARVDAGAAPGTRGAGAGTRGFGRVDGGAREERRGRPEHGGRPERRGRPERGGRP